MKKFIITVDSGCDIPLKECIQMDIRPIMFHYSSEDNIFIDSMNEREYQSFYANMRKGIIYKTSQINPDAYFDFFKKNSEENLPILHITLGSGISNTINSAMIARNMILDEKINTAIKVFDSKIGSSGIALFIYKAVTMRDKDCTLEETFTYLNSICENVNVFFTTDTLTYLARGGRLSKVEALLGNALRINPIIDITPEGKLRVAEKCHGSFKAYNHIIERVRYSVIEPENQTLYVCHSDNEVKAIELASRIVSEIGFKNYKMVYMGVIHGCHAGPGTIAIFYEGKKRTKKIESYDTILANKKALATE